MDTPTEISKLITVKLVIFLREGAKAQSLESISLCLRVFARVLSFRKKLKKNLT